MLHDGDRTRNVLEDLETEDGVVRAAERSVVAGLDRRPRHVPAIAQAPSGEVKEQVRNVRADELQITMAIAPGEGREHGRGPAAELGDATAARNEAREAMHAQRRERVTVGVREQMVLDTVIAPGVEMALVRDERRLVQLFELDRLQPLSVDAGQKV